LVQYAPDIVWFEVDADQRLESDSHKPVNRGPSIHGDIRLPDSDPTAVWLSPRD